jgi:hypothetical protein
MNNFFKNKEEYLTMIQSWKKFIKEGNHKKYKVFYDSYGYLFDKNGKEQFPDHAKVPYNTWKNDFDDKAGFFWYSDLTLLHHVLYNIFKNKKLEISIDINNEQNWIFIYQVKALMQAIRLAEEGKNENFDRWKKPFGNISLDDVKKGCHLLMELKLPLVKYFKD